MPYVEPPIKRAVTFFDLQDLFLSSKSAWGYSFPNFDPVELSRLVITRHSGWKLTGIHLYTGIHDSKKSPFWHNFWTKKLASHKAQDTRVDIFTTVSYTHLDVYKRQEAGACAARRRNFAGRASRRGRL